MQTFSDDDEVFLEAFSYDLCLISEALDSKRKGMGITDYGSYQKLQSIQRKLKQKGASLDPDIFVKVNSEDRLPDEWSDDEDFL